MIIEIKPIQIAAITIIAICQKTIPNKPVQHLLLEWLELRNQTFICII